MTKDFQLLFSLNTLEKVITGLVVTISSFFFDELLTKIYLIILTLTAIDCALGYIRAYSDKTAIVSRVMKRYMWKFAGYTIATSSLFLVGNAMPPVIVPYVGWFDDIALAFFAIHETISILEHLTELGVPFPKGIFKNLTKLKEGLDADQIEKYNNDLKK